MGSMSSQSSVRVPRVEKRPRRRLWLAATAGAAVLAGATMLTAVASTSGASTAHAKTVTITIGYSAAPGDTFYTNQFAAAEKAIPGIKIKSIVYPTYDEQLDEMPAEAAAGTLPDVIVWDNSAPVGQYAKEGAILPLTSLASADNVDLNADPSALIKAWTINGQLYGIPLYLQDSAFVYNETLLHEAGIYTLPTSMQQVATDAQEVYAKTGKGGLTILDNLFHLTQYELAFGGGWNFGKTIDSPQNVAGLQFLVNIFTKEHAGVLPDQVGAAWDGQVIAENDAAMSDGGPWYISFMAATAPKVVYSLRPIPTSTGKEFVVTYGGSYSMTSADKNPAETMLLLKHLTDAAAEKALVTSALGFVPASTKYIIEYRKLQPKFTGITNAVLTQGLTLDYPPKTIQFGNALTAGFQQIVEANSGTVKALLANLQKLYGTK